MGALKTPSARFAVAGLVALLLAAGLLVGRWWGQAGQTEVGRAADVLHVAPGCDVGRRPCPATAPGLGLSLAIGPGLSAMAAFPIRLRVTAAEWVPSEVILSFSMVGMDMGRNRYRLLPADSGASSRASSGVDTGVGDWQGRATLPLCATGRRDWTAELTVTMATGRVYRGVFPFAVE